MIAGVSIAADPEAVVVTAGAPFQVVSSAPLGGGIVSSRAIVNLHVPKDFAPESLLSRLSGLVQRRGLPSPAVGLATSAWTEKARIAQEASRGVAAVAVVTVGLSNPIAAGISSIAAPVAATINTVVVVDACAETAALVNAIITATEVKTSVLAAAGIRCADGELATGTSTDAVVIASTGRGPLCRFGGPISDLGWVVARAVRAATTAGVRAWLEDNPS
jgi:iron complex transport system ATP-binding protein